MAPSKRQSAASSAACTPSDVGSESGSIHTAPPLKKKKKVEFTPLKGERQAMQTFLNTTLVKGDHAATRVDCGFAADCSATMTPRMPPADAQCASSVISQPRDDDEDESIWCGSAPSADALDSQEEPPTAPTDMGEDDEDAPLSELHSSESAGCARKLLNTKLDLSSADGQGQLQSLVQSFAKPIIADHMQAASARTIPPRFQTKEKILAEAMQRGELDPRSSVGQEFYRATKKGGPLHQALQDAIKTKKDKKEAEKEFKVMWIGEQHANIQKKKVYEKAFQRVDKTKGHFKTLARIAIDEGNDALAWAGAQKLAAKCILMGGDWLMIDPMSELVKYLHLDYQWEEAMKEAWTSFESQSSQSTMQAVAGSSGTDKAIHAGRNKGGDKDRPGAVPKPQAKTDQVQKAAAALKSLIIKITSEAVSMQNCITTEKDWEWANSDMVLGKIAEASEALKANLRPFDKDYLLLNQSQIKKKYPADMAVHVKDFVKLKPFADALDKCLSSTRAKQMA
jgi:hypothetical protein